MIRLKSGGLRASREVRCAPNEWHDQVEVATIQDTIEPGPGYTLVWTTQITSASPLSWTNPVQFPFVWQNYTACGGDARYKIWTGSATAADDDVMDPWDLPVATALGETTMEFPSVNGLAYDLPVPPSTASGFGQAFEPLLVMPAWAQLDVQYDQGFGHVFEPSSAGFDSLLAGRTSGDTPDLDRAFFNYTRKYVGFGGKSVPAMFKHTIVTTSAGDWRETAAVAVGRSARQQRTTDTAAPTFTSASHPGIKALGMQAMLDSRPLSRVVVSGGRAVPTHRFLQALLLYGLQFELAPVSAGTMRPPNSASMLSAYTALFAAVNGAEWFFAPHAALVDGNTHGPHGARANVFKVDDRHFAVPVVWGPGSNSTPHGGLQPGGQVASVKFQVSFNWKIKVTALYPGSGPPQEVSYTLPNCCPQYGTTMVEVSELELRYGCAMLVVSGCMVGQC